MFNHITQEIGAWAANCQSLEEEKTEIIQRKRIQDLPLLRAAKENDIQRLKELLEDDKCDPFQRGAVGETALHVSVQYGNLEAAEVLLDEAPQLINQPMTSDLYRGQTALHLAAVNHIVDMVLVLIQRGADVSSPRATGSFFALSPKNLFYFGEHILTFAACVADTEIVKLLLDHGADLWNQDRWGNTILHILVLQPNKSVSCQMFDFLVSQDCGLQGKTLDEIPNGQGLTPLKLAAVEGNVVMFQHLIQMKRKVQWTFGPVTTMLYDMSEIDSWDKQKSILELIASSNKAHKILNLPPVKELLKKKWHTTGRPYIWFMAAIHVLYMICVSLCCANRPLKPRTTNITDPRDITLYVQKTLQEAYVTPDDYLRLLGEIISVIGAIILLLIELSQIRGTGLKYFIVHSFWKDPFRIVRISFSCLTLVVLILRLTDTDGEVVPMSMALVLGWCYIMYFARGFQMLGPFTIMIQKMAASDLLKFCWLMAVVVLGYSMALYVAYQTVDPQALGAFFPYFMTLISTYQLFLNILNGPANYTIDVPDMYRPLYGSFCVIAFLLMFNLLIAMMGDTQAAMAKKKDDLWKAQISGTTAMMERTLPKRLWFGSTEQNLEERQYLSVDERKCHAFPSYDAKESSSDSDEDIPPQEPFEKKTDDMDLATRVERRANVIYGTEDGGQVNYNDDDRWEEVIF